MTKRQVTVFVLDTDEQHREDILISGLRYYGFLAHGVGTAGELYRRMADVDCSVTVVDLDIPDENGLAVIRQVCRSRRDIGVIALGYRPIEQEGLDALHAGADNYLAKPLTIELLAAVIQSVVRRVREKSVPDTRWFLPTIDSGLIALTMFERSLLHVLEAHKGIPLNRAKIIELISGERADFEQHRLEMIVHRLRKKLLRSTERRLSIITVHGLGYALVDG